MSQERIDAPFNVMVTFSEVVVGFKAVSEVQISGGRTTQAHRASEPGEPTTRRYNEESNTLTYSIVPLR